MIQKNEKGSSQIQPTTKQFESLCFLGCSWLEAMARTQIHFNGDWFINHPNLIFIIIIFCLLGKVFYQRLKETFMESL